MTKPVPAGRSVAGNGRDPSPPAPLTRPSAGGRSVGRRRSSGLSTAGASGYSEGMSIIVSEVYDALIDAGASEPKAKAAAAAIPVGERLATKDDIAPLQDGIAQLKAEVAGLKVAVFTFGPFILALLIKLVFFP